MSYRAARSMMVLLIAGIIHRTEYDVKTAQPFPCLSPRPPLAAAGGAASLRHAPRGDYGAALRIVFDIFAAPCYNKMKQNRHIKRDPAPVGGYGHGDGSGGGRQW